MSNVALNWAFLIPIAGAQKSTLVALANHADERGDCWPSIDRLALLSGVTPRSVTRALQDLEHLGCLKISRSEGRLNRYSLAIGWPKTTDVPSPLTENVTPDTTSETTDIPSPPPLTPRPKPLTPRQPNPKEPSVQPSRTHSTPTRLFDDDPKPDPRGSRLPTDWQPTQDDLVYAMNLRLDPVRIAEDFRGYWCAKAGKDAKKTDWSLTWQGWCRREADRKGTLPLGDAVRPKLVAVSV